MARFARLPADEEDGVSVTSVVKEEDSVAFLMLASPFSVSLMSKFMKSEQVRVMALKLERSV